MSDSKQIEVAVTRLADASSLGRELRRIVVNHNLSQEVRKGAPHHIKVDAWQIFGEMVEVRPVITELSRIELSGKDGWQATCELVDQNGCLVGRGFSLCSRTEKMWSSRDDYAILSMAQTRAIGRAFRNAFGQIAKLAGYEAAPLEEMQGVVDHTDTPVRSLPKTKRSVETKTSNLTETQREKLGVIYKELISKGEAAACLTLKEAGIECKDIVEGFKKINKTNFKKVVETYEQQAAK